MSYPFIREDTGETVFLDFVTMMTKDVTGRVQTEIDGKMVTLIHDMEDIRRPAKKTAEAKTPRKILSDSLGFCESQLMEFEEDRRRSGIGGINFVKDPHFHENSFYQVQADSSEAMDAYRTHRGYDDGNNKIGSSAMISQDQLDRAAKQVLRLFPRPKAA